MAPPQPPFTTYLLPSLPFNLPISLPFRRRKSSAISTTSSNIPELSASPTSTPPSSPPTATYIPTLKSSFTNSHAKDIPQEQERKLSIPLPPVLRCTTCSTDIALSSQIVSKGFTGRHGRAFLVSIPTTSTSLPAHTSATTISTKSPASPSTLANTTIGRNQNRELLTGQHVVADISCLICSSILGWKYVDAREASQRYKIGKCILECKKVTMGRGWEDVAEEEEIWEVDVIEEEIEFDSGDEDECEDLFAGVWDRNVVAKRRGRKVSWRG